MSDNRIYYSNKPLYPVGPQAQPNTETAQKALGDKTFQEVLDNQINGVKFSGHAKSRLETRNIKLNQADLVKLNNAVDKVAQKGAKESLILMNDLALVVSIPNRTVITAMDGASIKDNVFTNIDSAVIV